MTRLSIRAVELALLLVLSASVAEAGSIGLMAGGGETPVGTLNATRTQYVGAVHNYIAADMDNNAADVCVDWHFPMPPDYVAAATITWAANMLNRGVDTAGALSMRLDIACTDNNMNYSTQSLVAGTAVVSSGTLPTTTFIFQMLGSAAGSVNEATCSPLDAVVVHFCRVGGDANTGNWSVVDLTLQY